MDKKCLRSEFVAKCSPFFAFMFVLLISTSAVFAGATGCRQQVENNGKRGEQMSHADSAKTQATREVASAIAQKAQGIVGRAFETVPLRKAFQGENTPSTWRNFFRSQVKYLTEKESQTYRLTIKNGRLYDTWGNLFDTSDGVTEFTAQGRAIFVMNERGEIYASHHQERGVFHHSSLVAGGPVAAAGEIEVKAGILVLVTDKSGHYQPPPRLLEQFLERLAADGVDVRNVKREFNGKL